jgi:SHS2 domain-containing protein
MAVFYMSKKGFEFLEHTADMYIVGYGKTLAEAFANTAVGLGFMIVSSDNVKPEIKKSIKVEAEDNQALLFEFLSKFLYFQDADSLIFHKVKVEKIEEKNGKWSLIATAWGEKFDDKRHETGTHVKAITYHYIEIGKEKGKYKVKVLVDI